MHVAHQADLARLAVIRLDLSPRTSLQQWVFDEGCVALVGRSSKCGVALRDDLVSRIHAAIFFDGSGWNCSCIGRNGMLVERSRRQHTDVPDVTEIEFSEGGPRLLLEPLASDSDQSRVEPCDVTIMLEQLQDGDDAVAGAVWNSYFPRVVALARKWLGRSPRRASDEEDVALSVLGSLYTGLNEGRFPDLNDRDILWRLLVVMTARKVVNAIELDRAQKPGDGAATGRRAQTSGMDQRGHRGRNADVSPHAGAAAAANPPDLVRTSHQSIVKPPGRPDGQRWLPAAVHSVSHGGWKPPPGTPPLRYGEALAQRSTNADGNDDDQQVHQSDRYAQAAPEADWCVRGAAAVS